MDKRVLKKVQKEINDIINSHDGLWKKVAETARKMEYTGRQGYGG